MNSLFGFVFKTLTRAFLSCKIPRFSESEDSSSDNDSEEEEPAPKVITQLPTKKLDIGHISKESSLSDMWSYVDYGEKDVNKLERRSFEIDNSYSYKQKKKTMKQKKTIKLNTRETKTNTPKSCKNLKLTDLNGYISLKILRQEEDIQVINEFVILVKDIKKKFRIIKEIIPRNADEYKKVPYSAKACIILFRFYFDEKFYINNAETAIETAKLAKNTQADKLLFACNTIIAATPYPTKNISVYFDTPYCFIGFSSLSSSSDICFPLYPIQLSLNEAFEKDIINTATIESVMGFNLISGVELCFNTETENDNCPLTIFYSVRSDHFSFENEVEVSLRSSINISFIQDITAGFIPSKLKVEGQKIKISITVQDIKPSLCFCSLDTQYLQKTLYGEFYVSLSSSRKTVSNISLFYLKKIYIYNGMESLEIRHR